MARQADYRTGPWNRVRRIGVERLETRQLLSGPSASGDSYVVKPGGILSGVTVLANDKDAQARAYGFGASLKARLIDGPSTGSLSLNADGTVVFQAPATFKGTASFTYQAVDAADVASNIATVRIDAADVAAPLVSISPRPMVGTIGSGQDFSAVFSTLMAASTINPSTFQLKDSSGAVVPATVAYDATTRTATLVPSVGLAAMTTFTATIAGGSAGVKDAFGHAMASDSRWTVATGDGTPGGVDPEIMIGRADGLITTAQGGIATTSIVLGARPSASVTVALTSSNPSAGTPSPASLTFTPDNWDDPQAVTIRGGSGSAYGAGAVYSILTAPATSADVHYAGLNASDIAVTNVNPSTRADLESSSAAEAQRFAYAEAHDMGSDMGGMAMMAEEQAVLALVQVSSATNLAIRSGGWSDPDTWAGRKVPAAGADVWVMPGRTVTVDAAFTQALHTVRVSGTLSFAADRNTQIRVDTVVVDPGGTFVMGTADVPIRSGKTAKVSFTDAGAIDRAWDPQMYSRGLISLGTVRVFGQSIAQMASMAPPATGARKLVLDGPVPSGWKVGDDIVFTQVSAEAKESPKRKILAIQGNTISIDPLGYTPNVTPGSGYKSYVADVSRNAIFQSENAADPMRHGHVMFMHNPDVQVVNAGFYDMGRTLKRDVPVDDTVVTDGMVTHMGTNPRARYAVHFHLTGTDMSMTPAVVQGCAVVGSPGWGIVNHGSYVSAGNNVVYGAVAGLVGETGSEIGDFTHNFVVGMYGNTGDNPAIQDWGRVGSGVWMAGGGIKVVNNVINDVKSGLGPFGAAISVVNYGHKLADGSTVQFDAKNLSDPAIAKGRALVPATEVPVYLVGNQAFDADAAVALRWNVAGSKSLIADSKFWWVGAGIDAAYTTGFTLSGSTIIGVPYASTGVNRDWPSDMVITNSDIEGFMVGVVGVPRGTQVIANTTLKNGINVEIGRLDPGAQNASSPSPIGRQITLSNIKFGAIPKFYPGGPWYKGVPYDVVMLDDEAIPANVYVTADDRQTLFDYLHGSGENEARRTWGLFQPQVITIDGHRVYANDQAANYVFHDTRIAEVDGKTNGQISSQYGLAMGDQITPAGATSQGLGFSIFGAKVGAMIAARPSFYVWPKSIANSGNTVTGVLNVYDTASGQLLSSAKFSKAKPTGPSWKLFTGLRDRAGNARSGLSFW